MIEFFIGLIAFSVGFASGSYFRSLIFSTQEWQVLKWDESVFAYRVTPIGYKIMRDEKAFMSLTLDTSQIPEGGIEIGGEEW